MSKGLPYFCWYPSDADTDENFRAMTDEQVGFYLRCLNHCWINGSLPADPGECARVMGRTLVKFDRLWERVGRCFVPSENDASRVVNPRQERERASAIEQRTKQSEGGKSTASKRWGSGRQPNSSPIAEQPLRASESVSDSECSDVRRGKSAEKGEVVPGLNPLAVLEELRPIYAKAGVPVSEKHEHQIIQYLVDIPEGRRHRVANYVKHSFVTGRWSSPRTTKTLLSVLQSGDWDVEITPRTLPSVPREMSKRESAHSQAAAIFMKEGDA